MMWKKVCKHLLTVMLLVVLLLCIPTTEVSAATGGAVTDTITWELNESTGVLTISGTGDMPDYNMYHNGPPFRELQNQVKHLVVEDGITSIGVFTFFDFRSLETVDLADSIKKIDRFAFHYCYSLQRLVLPQNLEYLGESAFSNCLSLETLVFPGNTISGAEGAFSWCSALRFVTLPREMTEIPAAMFSQCSSLKSISLPESVERIGEYAFLDCTMLYDITIPRSVTTIGAGAFEETMLIVAFFTGSGEEWNTLLERSPQHGLAPEYVHVNASNPGEHTWQDKNCTIRKTCPDCGYIDAPMEHLYSGYVFESPGVYVRVCEVCGEPDRYNVTVSRIFGETRYETSLKIADATKAAQGVEKFSNIIVASGAGFADALAGSYLAKVKDAPILMAQAAGKNVDMLKTYIAENLASGGTVYILGGVNAVPAALDTALSGYNVKRLAGEDRYETNLLILEEAGVTNEEILVCKAQDFADSLSASAVGKPILLVNSNTSKLTDMQKAYLAELSTDKFYIIGGETAVSGTLENAIKAYGSVERIAGEDRYETSVKVAQKFFSQPNAAVLAYARNFPDGLCGGPLALAMDAPLILTKTDAQLYAKAYTQEKGIGSGAVLGGTALIDDLTARDIFRVPVVG